MTLQVNFETEDTEFSLARKLAHGAINWKRAESVATGLCQKLKNMRGKEEKAADTSGCECGV